MRYTLLLAWGAALAMAASHPTKPIEKSTVSYPSATTGVPTHIVKGTISYRSTTTHIDISIHSKITALSRPTTFSSVIVSKREAKDKGNADATKNDGGAGSPVQRDGIKVTPPKAAAVKRQGFNGAEGSQSAPCDDCKEDGGQVKREEECNDCDNGEDGDTCTDCDNGARTFITPRHAAQQKRATTVSQTPGATQSAAVPAEFNNIPVTSGTKVIDELNGFRLRKGLRPFKWLANLGQNAYNTGVYDAGIHAEKHNLKPFANGEVISWGITDDSKCGRDISPYTPFGLAMLSWLCESPNDAAIGANCADALSIGHYYINAGETGHYDIIVDPSMTNAGCWFTANDTTPCATPWAGFWVCEFN
jgi:hypothetical protein